MCQQRLWRAPKGSRTTRRTTQALGWGHSFRRRFGDPLQCCRFAASRCTPPLAADDFSALIKLALTKKLSVRRIMLPCP